MFQDKTQKLMTILGLWLIVSVVPYGRAAAGSAALVALGQEDLLQVKVHDLIVDPNTKQPVVLLSDSRQERALLIWIDFFEARAIYSEMQGIKHPRPLTHDLLKGIIQQVNGKIHHIVITHVQDNIYYATIVLERQKEMVEIGARPSDSIVLALKFNAPVFVSKTLFEEMAILIGEQKEIEQEYGLILQELTPSLANYLSFGSNRGVLVSEVRKGSRAEKDGIEVEDIFVEVGGRAIEDVMSMKDALAKIKTSEKAKIFRKKRFKSIKLHLK
jgi:bifunctional DNase/RNase